MFAIGFYGECHGGKSTADFVQFSKNGGSNNCVANNLTLHCDNNGETECAGGEFAEYVYHLKQKAPERKISCNSSLGKTLNFIILLDGTFTTKTFF